MITQCADCREITITCDGHGAHRGIEAQGALHSSGRPDPQAQLNTAIALERKGWVFRRFTDGRVSRCYCPGCAPDQRDGDRSMLVRALYTTWPKPEPHA